MTKKIRTIDEIMTKSMSTAEEILEILQRAREIDGKDSH
jgi:hypothetical protein